MGDVSTDRQPWGGLSCTENTRQRQKCCRLQGSPREVRPPAPPLTLQRGQREAQVRPHLTQGQQLMAAAPHRG